MFSNYHSLPLNPLLKYTVLCHKWTPISSLWFGKCCNKARHTNNFVDSLLHDKNERWNNTTFEPAQHFLTLIKQHLTDIECEKLNGESVIEIHGKKSVTMSAGTWNKLQQWYIHPHVSLGTLVYSTPLSKTNWALAHKNFSTLL